MLNRSTSLLANSNNKTRPGIHVTDAPAAGRTGGGPDRTGFRQAGEQTTDFHYASGTKQSTDPELDPFPPIGSRLFQYELLEELGRGAFARVYLARQETLANRFVALKVSTIRSDEPRKLAKLRHTNIVPVYSVHQTNTLQLICMPYLGRRTLMDVETSLGGGPRSKAATLLRAMGIEHAHEGGSYVDEVLRIGVVLAEALEHAHSQGILHRDLKPANILITDEGSPLLLDFNVSSDQSGKERRVGGTPLYMAPEHLAAYIGIESKVDERSDLYSLGLVLQELMTGGHPYPSASRNAPAMLLLEDRWKPALPPSLRNREVSPAVDSIFAKLLSPDPESRYARAGDLVEDFRRQLHDMPLKHAPDKSLLERAAKWRRRNPRTATAALAGVASVLLVVAPAFAVARHQEVIAKRAAEIRKAEAENQAAETIGQLKTASLFLGSRVDPSLPRKGMEIAKAEVKRYGLDDAGTWTDGGLSAPLGRKTLAELREAFGEALLLLSRAECRENLDSVGSLDAALRWNMLARREFPENDVPGVLERQRREIEAKRNGLTPPENDLKADAPAGSRDAYFDGLDAAAGMRPADALKLLIPVCESRPDSFRAWFSRGVCHDAVGQFNEAATAFSICIVLRPMEPVPYLNRAIVHKHLGRNESSERDCDRALERKRDWTAALMNRGIARMAQNKWRDAEADFSSAMRNADAPSRLWFLRSRARSGAGDAAGAEADRLAGLAADPKDTFCLETRGRWWMDAGEWTKALADFDAALALAPGSSEALWHKALVLADNLGRTEEAVRCIDRLLQSNPDDCEARGTLGVYLARLGRCSDARIEAERVLAKDKSPFRLYQLASLYALVAKIEGSDKDRMRAHALMASAFKAGYDDWKTIDEDSDIDFVRKDPEVTRIIAAARLIAGTSMSDKQDSKKD